MSVTSMLHCLRKLHVVGCFDVQSLQRHLLLTPVLIDTPLAGLTL